MIAKCGRETGVKDTEFKQYTTNQVHMHVCTWGHEVMVLVRATAMGACLFVCSLTLIDSRIVVLLGMEPELPGTNPKAVLKAGRSSPVHAFETDPLPLHGTWEIALWGSHGPQNGGLS